MRLSKKGNINDVRKKDAAEGTETGKCSNALKERKPAASGMIGS